MVDFGQVEEADTSIPREISQWNMFIHLSTFLGMLIPLGGLIAPIVMWQMKKDDHPSVARHGKEVLNYIFTMLIAAIVCAILTIIFIGLIGFWIIGIYAIVVPIIAAIKANEGRFYSYPFIIRFMK